jgi:O-antigen/teichoic acid export membrane protein
VLPVDALAMYWIAVSALGFVTLIAQTGVGQVVMSQVSQAIAHSDKCRARSVSGNALAVVAVTGFATAGTCTAMLACGIPSGGREVSLEPLLFVLVGGVLCPFAMQLVDTLRAQQRLVAASWLAAQPQSGGIVPSTVLLVGLTVVYLMPTMGDHAHKLVYGFFLFGWLSMLLIAVVLIARQTSLAPSTDALSLASIRSLLRDSAPVLSGSLAMFLITQADLWIVNFYLGADETAAYGIASTLVKYVSAINVLLGALLPGLVGQLWAQHDHGRLAGLLIKLARFSAAAAVSVAFAIFLFGDQLLVALAGPGYYASVWGPLLCLAIGHVANSLLGYSQVVLITAGVLRPIGIASVVASLGTVVALVIATPHWGMLGAAIISAAGIIVYNGIICVGCIRATGIACHVFARTERLQTK